MTRLIDDLISRKALLEAMRDSVVIEPKYSNWIYEEAMLDLIANAPTIQREGWQIVPIKEMVNRFLGWKLPSDFSPDCGIEFDANKYPNHKFEPIGTNLFTANQAKEMIEHMLSAAPTDTE